MLIGDQPPTLRSTVGLIHPLVALIHGWCDSTTSPCGGGGATTTPVLVSCCSRPFPITSYDVVAVSVAAPGAAAAGRDTAKVKVAAWPGASTARARSSERTDH